MKPLVLGTRGSALALAQVALVRSALAASCADLGIEVREITTTGDRKVDMSLVRVSPAGAKGLFTKEIEELLLRGDIDFAVHSLKDLAGATTEGLEVVAVLERASTSDVLVAREPVTLDTLPAGAVVGTSSVRRARQLCAIRPDVRVAELRGNVPTRLRKLCESAELTGIVLAEAGLQRLGFDIRSLEAEGTRLHVEDLGDRIFPAIGQGAIALQCRSDDVRTRSVLKAINHRPSFLRIRAERELLRLLNGDCQLPVGARTQIEGNSLRMEAVVFGDERPRTAGAMGMLEQPEEVAQMIYRRLAL